MSGPPDNIEAAELFRKLSEAPCPSRIVDFPRRGPDGKPIQQVRIQVLTMEQHDIARMRAKNYLTGDTMRMRVEDLDHSPGREIMGDATACEILAMSVVNVKPMPGTEGGRLRYGPFFTGGQAIKQLLAADEVAALFAAYVQVQREIGPYEGMISSDEELTAWIKRLEQGASAVPLAPYPSHQLAELALSLAVRASSLSRTLESLLSSSPNTSVSVPESWGLGTFSATGEQSEPIETSGEKSPERLTTAGEAEPITIAQAARAAELLRNS